MIIARRLADGYLSILTRLLRGILALLVLALLAAAISLPLWALANGARIAYNLVFALAVFVGLVFVAIARRRTSVHRHHRGAPMVLLRTVLPVTVILLGIIGRSAAAAIIGLAVLSIPLAWSFGARQ